MDAKDFLVIAGLFINFVGVLFAIFNSRIKLERRLTRVETMIAVIARNCKSCSSGQMRSSDYDTLTQIENRAS